MLQQVNNSPSIYLISIFLSSYLPISLSPFFLSPPFSLPFIYLTFYSSISISLSFYWSIFISLSLSLSLSPLPLCLFTWTKPLVVTMQNNFLLQEISFNIQKTEALTRNLSPANQAEKAGQLQEAAMLRAAESSSRAGTLTRGANINNLSSLGMWFAKSKKKMNWSISFNLNFF